MRFEGEQVLPGDKVPPDNAGGLLLNSMNCVPEAEAEFNEWYNNEHIPMLAAVPGVLCARRFRATSANRRYVALYHLASPEVQATPAWKSAADSTGPTRCGRISATICASSACDYERHGPLGESANKPSLPLGRGCRAAQRRGG